MLIVIRRMQGATHEVHDFKKGKKFSTFQEVDGELREWSATAPVEAPGHKVAYEVRTNDGEVKWGSLELLRQGMCCEGSTETEPLSVRRAVETGYPDADLSESNESPVPALVAVEPLTETDMRRLQLYDAMVADFVSSVLENSSVIAKEARITIANTSSEEIHTGLSLALIAAGCGTATASLRDGEVWLNGLEPATKVSDVIWPEAWLRPGDKECE